VGKAMNLLFQILLLINRYININYNQTLKVSLCLVKHSTIKTEGVEIYLHAFITSPLDEGKSLASRLCPFSAGK
jgi:hypothetical protein